MKTERRGIGEKLRELRKHRRLTLAMLGKRTGYSLSALSKMENGRLGVTYDKLTKLAVALDAERRRVAFMYTPDLPADS
jgi:transcriptional regulator with XRE-family HTH domain